VLLVDVRFGVLRGVTSVLDELLDRVEFVKGRGGNVVDEGEGVAVLLMR
jgi:hypothetical protein